jgi:hypothetical protein
VNGFVEYRWNEDANGRGYGYGGGYGEFSGQMAQASKS